MFSSFNFNLELIIQEDKFQIEVERREHYLFQNIIILQVFIGHSSSISQVQFTPLGSHVISCGDAVFIWEFLGPIPPLHPFYPSTPPRQQKVTSLRSASPRKRAPAPLHFEPLKMQSFTPVAQSQKLKSHGQSLINYSTEASLYGLIHTYIQTVCPLTYLILPLIVFLYSLEDSLDKRT